MGITEESGLSLLETFDQPFMNPNCVQRGLSVVSSQALHMMNSDLTRENARFMAGRIIDAVGEDLAAQVERAYLLAFARVPTADESRMAVAAKPPKAAARDRASSVLVEVFIGVASVGGGPHGARGPTISGWRSVSNRMLQSGLKAGGSSRLRGDGPGRAVVSPVASFRQPRCFCDAAHHAAVGWENCAIPLQPAP